MTRIALLSTSDTDLLSARASGADYAYANPVRLTDDTRDALITEADLVVLRILGSPEDVRDLADVDGPRVARSSCSAVSGSRTRR